MTERKRLFSPAELSELAIPLPDRISQQIKNRDVKKAIELARKMKGSRVVLHDFFADSCTVLWSWVGEHLGENIMEDMFRYVFLQAAQRQLYSIGILFRIYMRFAASLLAESGWRAHSCFGAGDFPAQFSVTEDDEKFSYQMKPCASGARLWLRGIYEPSRGGKLSKNAHWWTWNRKEFPYYCMHCPFLNEMLPYESMGYLMWPVDELKTPHDVCTWHLYKDPNRIPDHYYKRLGITKKEVKPVKTKRKKSRYFTKDELREISRPIPDRIIEKLNSGDLSGANKLCTMVRDEFLFLHDLYMNMLVATLTFISMKAGEEALGNALLAQYKACVVPKVIPTIRKMPAEEKIKFLALNIFSTDNCNNTGIPRGKFTIKETDESVQFILKPCGSGGRLLRGGAYQPLCSSKKVREKIEDSLVVSLMKLLPIPDSFLDWMFLTTGGYVCQRKPYDQGRTKLVRSWSFNRANVPYYCCQCGMIQAQIGTECLKIIPPIKKHDPCIWEFDKKYLEARQ
jgi:hypothetical protein